MRGISDTLYLLLFPESIDDCTRDVRCNTTKQVGKCGSRSYNWMSL